MRVNKYEYKVIAVVLFVIDGMSGANYLILSPIKAHAQTQFSAGVSGGPICNCPVTVGNCVCAFTKPTPSPVPVDPAQTN
jgi:hypothetical protein